MTYFIKILLVILIINTFKADVLSLRHVNIYNIREGLVLTGFSSFFTKEIQSKPIVQVRNDGFGTVSNWQVVFKDGHQAFVNQVHSSRCITYKGKNKLLGFDKCTYANNQLFEVIPTSKGESFIKVKGGDNQCLYAYSGLFVYYTFTGTCPNSSIDNKWLWYLLPEYSEQVQK